MITCRYSKTVRTTLPSIFQALSEAHVGARALQPQHIVVEGTELLTHCANQVQKLINKLAEAGHIATDLRKRANIRGLREQFAVTAQVGKTSTKNFGAVIASLLTSESIVNSRDENSS